MLNYPLKSIEVASTADLFAGCVTRVNTSHFSRQAIIGSKNSNHATEKTE